MRTEPPGISKGDIARTLDRHWDFHASALEYLPVGFGSHHWAAVDAEGSRRFITVDDLTKSRLAGEPDAALDALDRAFRTAALLRDQVGLGFVVGPVPNRDGAVAHRVDDRHALSMFPYLDGEPLGNGGYASVDDRRRVLDMLGRLHRATADVPADLPQRDDFTIPSRPALLQALAELDRPWNSGPFGEPARKLLKANSEHVRQLLTHYDSLVGEIGIDAGAWVVTHGEPHSANWIRNDEDRLQLVDWDTLKVAPRERDLSMVLGREDRALWGEYLSAAGPCSLDDRAIRLYRHWWELAEIAEYVDLFRRAHERTADTQQAWDDLSSYLPLHTQRT